jgi:uncharacterized protein YbaR (Trm112 family)
VPSSSVALNPSSVDQERPGRFIPGVPLHCPQCKLTLHPATVQHEQALVSASCCPRCDGPLTATAASDNAALISRPIGRSGNCHTLDAGRSIPEQETVCPTSTRQ